MFHYLHIGGMGDLLEKIAPCTTEFYMHMAWNLQDEGRHVAVAAEAMGSSSCSLTIR